MVCRPCRVIPGEKSLNICLFVSTEFTNVTDGRTDRQTDRQTPHDGIGRACIASRGKTDLINIGSVEILFTTGMLN